MEVELEDEAGRLIGEPGTWKALISMNEVRFLVYDRRAGESGVKSGFRRLSSTGF